MAQHYTNFSEYPVGQSPSDWHWHVPNPGTFGEAVESDQRAADGVSLRVGMYPAGNKGYVWDVGNNTTDAEVVMKIRFTYAFPRVGAVVRAAEGDYPSYAAVLSSSAFTIARVQTSSSTSTVGSVPHTTVLNTWYWIRLRVIGTQLTAKVWADGEAEPVVWAITGTNTQQVSGGVGVMAYGKGTTADCSVFLDCVGIGTNGDTAPTEPVGPTPQPETITASAHRTVQVTWTTAQATHRATRVQTTAPGATRRATSTTATTQAASKRSAWVQAILATATKRAARLTATLQAATKRTVVSLTGNTIAADMVRRVQVQDTATGATQRRTSLRDTIQGAARRTARVASSVVQAATVRRAAAQIAILADTLRRVVAGAPRPSGSLTVTVLVREASLGVEPRAPSVEVKPRQAEMEVRR